MIKFENAEVTGWEAAIRGMRNPMNSWKKSDSGRCSDFQCGYLDENDSRPMCTINDIDKCDIADEFIIGPNDLDLMTKLRNAGTDHRKFMRMITVYVDITAPLYWWKEFDTYKVGTVANSCSTMHKIHAKEFTLGDFSHEHLFNDSDPENIFSLLTENGEYTGFNGTPLNYLQLICNILNYYRNEYLETKDKKYWWQMIQLLPSSYNQKRTVMMNYEVLANIYKSRKNHKLDEWAEHSKEEIIKDALNGSFGFCDWIKTLPYSELITQEGGAL